MSLETGIKHFFGKVWSGVVKVEQVIEKDSPAIEADLETADDLLAFVNPAAGAIGKEIIGVGLTALGAVTEALEATTKTVAELTPELREFTTLTVRTQALQQVEALLKTYRTEFDEIKAEFLAQVAAGAKVDVAIPKAVAAKS